jgi:hypothetical protein
MSLFSRYSIDVLLYILQGKQLEEYCPITLFKDPAEFKAQTPSIHPLGRLSYIGGDCAPGDSNSWVTADGTFIVSADADGVIFMIDSAD